MVEGAAVKETGLFRSFVCAFRGLSYAWRDERNFRIQLGHLVLVAILGCWLRPELSQFALVLFGALVLLSAEMANSALERVVDLVTEAYHPLAKAAKDLAAGAVLVTALGSGSVTLIVFYPFLELGAWLGLSSALALLLIVGRR